jgi:predicted  nucleic acid-binding Zn-ribbon protein
LEQEKTANQRQKEHESLVQRLMNPKEDSQTEMQKAIQSEQKWKAQCQELVEKLDAEVILWFITACSQ